MNDIGRARVASRQAENREALPAAVAAADLLAVLMDHAKEAHIACLDQDMNFLFVNEAYAKGSGHRAPDLIGRNHFDLFPNSDNERAFRRVVDTGEACDFRARPFTYADQPWRGVTYWDWSLSPVMNGTDVVALVLTLVDVTEHVREKGYSEALNSILTHFVVAQQPDQVLAGIVQRSVDATGAHCSTIWVLEEKRWIPWHVTGCRAESPSESFGETERPLVLEAARTMELQFVEDVDADTRVNKEWLASNHTSAFALVPLVLKGRVLGILELSYRDGPKAFDVQLRRFLGRLAVAASIALEKAHEFEREHRVSQTLQSALLAVPERVAGVTFGHRYMTASSSARVGGDFYDVFERDERVVGLTIGDVSGKGVQAAALTSLVKHTIRANAVGNDLAPDAVMSRANDVLFRTSAPEEFVTVFFALLDRDTGRLTYCNAGHTTAFVVRTDGSIVQVTPNGPFVGAFGGVPFLTSETRLEPGDVLVTYTDGLTEARSGREQFGEKGVLHVIGSMRSKRPQAIVDSLMEEVSAFTGDRLSDDLALMAVSLARTARRRPQQQTLDLGLELMR